MCSLAKEKLGVLCSGRGTDLQSIIDAIEAGQVPAEIAIVLTDKEAYALERARKAGIEAVCVDRKQFDGREPFEKALIEKLEAAGVTLVVLAGFMRILTPYFVGHFAGRIMNIHPALLPSFPGAHAHRDVLAYGVKYSSGAASQFPRRPCPSGCAGLWRESQRLYGAFRGRRYGFRPHHHAGGCAGAR